MTVDKAKADEFGKLCIAAAAHYDAARATVGQRYSEVIREIGVVLSDYHNGDIDNAKAAVKRACDLAYELTGDCEQIDPIAAIVGYEDEEHPSDGAILEGAPSPVKIAETEERVAAAIESCAQSLSEICQRLEAIYLVLGR